MARLQPDSSLSPSSPKTIPGIRFGKFRDSGWLDGGMRVPRSIGTDLAMLKWDPSGPVVVPLRKGVIGLEAKELRRHHERLVLPGLRESDPGPNPSAYVLLEMWPECIPTEKRAPGISGD